MQPLSLLPAFLAGFACCGGLGAVLLPTFLAPINADLRSAREEAAVAQRALIQERAMQQQVDTTREAAARLAKDVCEHQVTQAVAQAEELMLQR